MTRAKDLRGNWTAGLDNDMIAISNATMQPISLAEMRMPAMSQLVMCVNSECVF
jgi:hypothetical protein